ncbi:hypothetical protein Tco_0280345 [Tanacetum coccineum]
MDDPNITMEEYIKLEEEKAQKRGKVFNWETAKFSDDEDYTVIFDKNSFSYKIISSNNLKTDSKNDNEKVNLPSLPSPGPTISCFDDFDFFKDFDNEFPAIVYNNAQTSKSDLLTGSILSPQHIVEFDLNDKTSLFEYDEDEQNVLYFNDLFPFNIIHPDDLKLKKDNDDNEIDIIQSSEDNEITQGSNKLLETSLNTTYPGEWIRRIDLFRLNGYYYDENKGSYGPQFSEAHSEASHINNSIPQKEKYLGSFTLPCFINNVCFDDALVDLGASVSVMPFSTYLNLGLGKLAHTKLTVELADKTVKYPKGIAENVLVVISKFVFPVDFVILDMPEDIKVPLILGRPFLSTARAKIDIYKRKITLRVGEERIVFTSVKPASSLIKRVYMLSLRERMELNLEARLMGEIWRNQGDDLMPTIEEGEDLVKEISTNIGREFTNLEILKCWSLETSRRINIWVKKCRDEVGEFGYVVIEDEESILVDGGFGGA